MIFVFCLMGLALVIRSARLQLIPHKKLSHLKSRIFKRTVTLKPERGFIYDRYGKELAISIPSMSLFADPLRLQQPYWAGKKLSEYLGLPRKAVLKKLLNKKRRFIWIKRHLSDEQAKEIRSWKIEGLELIKESKRFYTHSPSLAPVIGFTGIDGEGLEGIEKRYDSILKGESQKLLVKRDAKGRPLFVDFEPFITKAGGFDIYLSIDSDLQFYLQKELQQAIYLAKADSAIGIILSAENSEVLAMANLPGYNPNKLSRADRPYIRNRAVTDIFEPGSTLKTFTVVSALKKGISFSKTYSSEGGRLLIGSSVIKEAEPQSLLKDFLSLPEILSLSSNVGAASLALDIGAKDLRRNLRDFGFGRLTGIDFPGEAKGLLRPLPWKPIEIATIGFGHGVAGTALQIANAYSALANGGLLNRPFLLKRIKNPYTGEEKTFSKRTIDRVLSPEQARSLSFLLVSVTGRGGTGAKAVVPGYWTAGKTGTAQKVSAQGGYKKGEYITSFAGFIPANKPKFVIYLMIDGAKENFYASSLTAPLFSRVASYAVRRAGLSPAFLKEGDMIPPPRLTLDGAPVEGSNWPAETRPFLKRIFGWRPWAGGQASQEKGDDTAVGAGEWSKKAQRTEEDEPSAVEAIGFSHKKPVTALKEKGEFALEKGQNRHEEDLKAQQGPGALRGELDSSTRAVQFGPRPGALEGKAQNPPPSHIDSSKRTLIPASKKAQVVPDLKGLSLREALKAVQTLGRDFEIHGSGYLVRSVPSSGALLKETEKIILFFEY